LPENVSVGVVSASERSDRAYVSINGFALPTQLALLDAASVAAPVTLKTLPARFDATGVSVEQFEAVSSDGTKVPYFVVRPRGAKADGSTPTLMTAYGGFELARLPTYLGATGKIWLERGRRLRARQHSRRRRVRAGVARCGTQDQAAGHL
jgi:prolyl oligopeptidase